MKKKIIAIILLASIIDVNAGYTDWAKQKASNAYSALAAAVSMGYSGTKYIAEGTYSTAKHFVQHPIIESQRLISGLTERASNTLSYMWDTFNKGFDTTRSMNAPIGSYRRSMSREHIQTQKDRLNVPPEGASQQVIDRYNKNKKTVAYMQTNLMHEEQFFIEKRKEAIAKNLQKTIDNEVFKKLTPEQMPKIAMCLSGGGDRARTAAAGAIKGAEEIDLLNKMLYVSGLSGGTWTMAPRSLGIPIDALVATWIKYGKIPVSKDITNALRKYPYLALQHETSPHCSFREAKVVQDNIERKFYFDQQIDSMDLWGTFIAHLNLAAVDDSTLYSVYNKDNIYPRQTRQRLLFSQAADYLLSNNAENFPLPIGTAVTHLHSRVPSSAIKRQNVTQSKMLWFEFTPWSIGTRYINQDGKKQGAFVPTWSFNRSFKKEQGRIVSADFAPEMPLGNFLGTWGSAYTISSEDLLRITGVTSNFPQWSNPFKKIINSYMKYAPSLIGQSMHAAKTMRILPATFFNFMQFNPDSPLQEKYVPLVDAGLDFNVPTPPLLERNSDVIIIIDASAGVITYDKEGNLIVSELLKAEEWAHTNKMPFPAIAGTKEYDSIPNNTMTIFEGKEHEPTICYIPLSDPKIKQDVKDNPEGPKFSVADCYKDGDCSTFNFNYSEKNIRGIVDFMRRAIVDNKKRIEKVIIKKAQQKSVA